MHTGLVLRPEQEGGGLPGLDPLHDEAFPSQGGLQLQRQPQTLWNLNDLRGDRQSKPRLH